MRLAPGAQGLYGWSDELPFQQRFRDVFRWTREAGIRLDVMQTGAAARTYNVLLAENRKVGAALTAARWGCSGLAVSIGFADRIHWLDPGEIADFEA